MRTPPEPVVVTIHPPAPEPRSATLADVLVVIADEHLPARYFVRYAGLALLVVVNCDGRVRAEFRDGTVLTFGTARPGVPPTDWIEALAELLFFSWVWVFHLPGPKLR